MRLTVIFSILLSIGIASAQSLDKSLDGTERGKKLTEFLSELEARHKIQFYFLPEWIDGLTIPADHKLSTIDEVLTYVLSEARLAHFQMNEYVVVILKDPAAEMYRMDMLRDAATQRKSIRRMTFGTPDATRTAGTMVTLRGKVVDKETGAALAGSTVVASEGISAIHAVSQADGSFSIQLPVGSNLVSFGYVNHDDQLFDLEIYQDTQLVVEMEETPTVLDELVISAASRGENTTSRLGQTQINIRQLKRAPALLGENDLIKQVQMLPGVTTAGEAASGFNVRGGGVDQNLVLYDGVPVFNSSHAFGFFSSFNTEAVRDVAFYRGGIPAEYGGRASSVLDIRSKEGDYEKWQGGAGIGLISTNLFVNGPINKGTTSIAASTRLTYSNWLINTVRTNYADLKNAKVFFYDGTVKLAHRINQKTKLTASAYSSNDQFRLTGDSTYQWSNLTGVVRLDHEISDVLSMSFSAGAGSYQYKLFSTDSLNGFNLAYRITYPFIKGEVQYQRDRHHLSGGFQSMFYSFQPGTLTGSEGSNFGTEKMENQYNLESAIYASDELTLPGEKVSLEGGIRISMFNSIGPATVNLYQEDAPLDPQTFTGTMQVPKGDFYKTYMGFEPRASVRYSFSPTFSAKAGYNRMYQYMHLVTNTTAITPIDIWQPSGYYFKPQVADQLSFGLFKDFKDKTYETFAEVYYKRINNITDFKDGAQLILNSHLETDLLQGIGTMYGIEFSGSKTAGRFTGSFSYAYSRTFRLIAGPTDAESINNGKKYPSNFDQPNVVNLSWRYGLRRRIFFTGYFTYRTGRPITVPESGFVIDNITVAAFSERNRYRIPDYHRLDLALVFEGNHKRRRLLDGTLSLSIYNIYGRRNAYSVFFRPDEYGYMRAYKLSIIGTALPSVSYSFKI
jgi:hypothetical protein